MFTLKLWHDFDEKLNWLHQSYLRKPHRLRIKIELSHTREEIRQNKNYAFTPVRHQKTLNARILFIQGEQLQEHRRRNSKPEVQNSEEGTVVEEWISSKNPLEFRGSNHGLLPKLLVLKGPQHDPPQNTRHQVEIDVLVISQIQEWKTS